MDASEVLATPSGFLCRKFVRSGMHAEDLQLLACEHEERQEESEENGDGGGERREMSVEDKSELGVEDEEEIEGEGFPSRGSSMVAEASGSLQLQSPRSPQLPQSPQLPGFPQSPETEPPPTPYVFSADSEGKSELDGTEAEWTDTESEPDWTLTGVDKDGSNWDETSQEAGWEAGAALNDRS